MKLKSVYLAKDTVTGMKLPTELEKIFARYPTNRRVSIRMYKELKKKQNYPIKYQEKTNKTKITK